MVSGVPRYVVRPGQRHGIESASATTDIGRVSMFASFGATPDAGLSQVVAPAIRSRTVTSHAARTTRIAADQ
jgi:hypothetical protein